MSRQLHIVVPRPWVVAHFQVSVPVHFCLEWWLPPVVGVCALNQVILPRAWSRFLLLLHRLYILFPLTRETWSFLEPLYRWFCCLSGVVPARSWCWMLRHPIALLFSNQRPVPFFTITRIGRWRWLAQFTIIRNIRLFQINFWLLIKSFLTGPERLRWFSVINYSLEVGRNTTDWELSCRILDAAFYQTTTRVSKALASEVNSHRCGRLVHLLLFNL